MNPSSCITCSLAMFCSVQKSGGFKPRQRYLKRNDILHHAQDSFTGIYAIHRGVVKAHEADHAGNELIRHLYFRHEVYGYDALCKGRYISSATALTQSVVCEVAWPDLLGIIHSDSHLLSCFLLLLSQQLTCGMYLKYISAQQRLSAFILDLSFRLSGNSANAGFELPVKHEDIGSYLGLAAETVSRIFSRFKACNIITIEKKIISILEPEKLKQIAKGVLQV